MTGIITSPQCQKEWNWLQWCSLCIFISSWNLWSRQFETSLWSELLLSLTLLLHNLMPVDTSVLGDDFIFSTRTVLECIKCSCIISVQSISEHFGVQSCASHTPLLKHSQWDSSGQTIRWWFGIWKLWYCLKYIWKFLWVLIFYVS